MSDDLPDIDDIDGSPLRAGETRALRLLLEKERARERLVRKIKFWIPVMTAGTTGMVAAHQSGFIDWIAGMIVRMKQ